jgi:hypothetical protein
MQIFISVSQSFPADQEMFVSKIQWRGNILTRELLWAVAPVVLAVLVALTTVATRPLGTGVALLAVADVLVRHRAVDDVQGLTLHLQFADATVEAAADLQSGGNADCGVDSSEVHVADQVQAEGVARGYT